MNNQNLEMDYIVRFMSEEIHVIIELDLDHDSLEVIKSPENKLHPGQHNTYKMSEWVQEIAKSGQIYPEDNRRFLEKMNPEYIRNHFLAGNRKLSISYRRMLNYNYQWVALRMIPAKDYAIDNQKFILFVQEDDSAESLDLIQTAKQHFAILQSLSNIYVTLHVLNLENDYVFDLNGETSNGVSFVKYENATQMMHATMQARVREDYLEQVLEFSEVSTMQDRMKNKSFMSMDFQGKQLGWIRASIITIDTDEEGRPKHVIFATSSVDEEKKQEEKLLQISTEMNLATTIQTNIIPHLFPAFPNRKEFDLYASMDPAKEVGGDFYDYFFIDDHRIAFVIADVSGKGVPAALFMMVSKVLIKNQNQVGDSPAKILEIVNNHLCDGNNAEMFVTVWLGILDLRTGVMTAANAGHEYPAIGKAGGNFELYKDKHGFVLAGMPNMKYKEYEITLQPGDKIFVYTDGVTEATNRDNQLFGTARMLEALNAVDFNDPSVDCKTLLASVRKHIDDFVLDAPQFDDITMLAFQYNGPNVDYES